MMMDLLNSETGQWFGWVFLIFTGIASIIYVIYDYFKNPFLYPGIRVPIDLSGKRQPSYVECIDEWINSLDNPRQDIKDMYNNALERWENECLALISKTILWRSHKRKIYQGMRENAFRKDYRIFEFEYYRIQTRYRQQSYQKYSYKVENVEYRMGMALYQLLEIDDELEEINYETTRKKYEAKNQRKLMTPALKMRIKKRDNYTCQNCGKYMPDEVGLHIDHIIPISKGGKSVESNLQVLCDKCNVRKGAKKKPVNSQISDDYEEAFSFFDGFDL